MLRVVVLMTAVMTTTAGHAAEQAPAAGAKGPQQDASQQQAPAPQAQAQAQNVFDFEDVIEQARTAAAKAFAPPQRNIPDWLAELSFDKWQTIEFDTETALWRGEGLPFHVQFFHPGVYYDHTVPINLVVDGEVRPARFETAQFIYGDNALAERVPEDLGYAGFRIHYAFNGKDNYRPISIFLGASYFRAVARNQVYGVSARGLAIDTGLPSGEEFPYFREFWLIKPEPGADSMTVYALLDSASLSGAYRFVVKPGEETVISVEATLFRRKAVQKLGVAPLTSMFLFGENSTREFEDFRPEVHNSDGLMVHSGSGEWIWRPLVNPLELQINEFMIDGVRGFGVVQRDREFDHYQDLQSHFERRPSVWVEPRGDWGKGRVELVQIPSERQENDNIVAFWVPAGIPKDLKQPLHFTYDLHWFSDKPSNPPAGYVSATRREAGRAPESTKFVIDFIGGKLPEIGEDANVQGVINVDPGWKLLESQTLKNEVTGGWRLIAVVQPQGDEPLAMRAFLQRGNDALTETWTYTVNP